MITRFRATVPFKFFATGAEMSIGTILELDSDQLDVAHAIKNGWLEHVPTPTPAVWTRFLVRQLIEIVFPGQNEPAIIPGGHIEVNLEGSEVRHGDRIAMVLRSWLSTILRDGTLEPIHPAEPRDPDDIKAAATRVVLALAKKPELAKAVYDLLYKTVGSM